MAKEIANIEPKAVWENFYKLTQVPRPSKKEEKIQAFMVDFGKSLGLVTEKDSVGNVLIRKPATAGMENRKGIILQGHLDMVPQKIAVLPTISRRIRLMPLLMAIGFAPVEQHLVRIMELVLQVQWPFLQQKTWFMVRLKRSSLVMKRQA